MREPQEVDLSLRSPKFLAVLAELGGRSIDISELWSSVENVAGWAMNAEEPMWPVADWRPEDDAQWETAHALLETIADPELLLLFTAWLTSDWPWNPTARRRTPALLANATAYRQSAAGLCAAPGSGWWWETCQVNKQVIITGSGTPPPVDKAARWPGNTSVRVIRTSPTE